MLSSLTVLSLAGAMLLSKPVPEPDLPLIEDAKLQAAGMYRYWQAHLPIAKGDSLSRGHLVDEALYVTTKNGSLFALQADVGLIRWGVKLTEPGYRIWAPTHLRVADGTGHVVVNTSTKTSIFDRFTGQLVLSFVPTFPPGGPAVAYDDKLFMGGADGRFYSLQLVGLSWAEPYKRWEVLAGRPITAAPVLYDYDMLLFASQGGEVYSCAAPDKTLNWVFRTGGPIMGDPVVDDAGGAYVASMDRSLYKVSSATGSVVWRVRMPRPLVEGPIISGDTAFQFCVDNGISAVDADAGQERWRSPEGRAFVAHTPNGDIIHTTDGRLLILDHETGGELYTLEARSVMATVPNTRDDAAYLLGSDGRVLCIRVNDVPYLRRQQVISAREQLNRTPTTPSQPAGRIEGRTGEQVYPSFDDPLRSNRDTRP